MRTVITWCMLLVAVPCFFWAFLSVFTGGPHGLTAFMVGVVLLVWGAFRDWRDNRHAMTRAQRARGYFWGK